MIKKRFVVSVPADCTYLYEVEAVNPEEALDRVERGEAGEYILHTDGYAQPRSEWSWREATEGEQPEEDRRREDERLEWCRDIAAPDTSVGTR
jgi:hypothetical protein